MMTLSEFSDKEEPMMNLASMMILCVKGTLVQIWKSTGIFVFT